MADFRSQRGRSRRGVGGGDLLREGGRRASRLSKRGWASLCLYTLVEA